ncbi:hypothetical protein NDU88_008093 [Pleurodeles waltl]|uniref:Uncharacterized protein n=1 Tax=Pleurodeles waltl TaxID=8319 RepID=A0AAV7QNY1_PLEWA|nr:hypothetical protein NDU88_008093 [Pleurodeles waltl]
MRPQRSASVPPMLPERAVCGSQPAGICARRSPGPAFLSDLLCPVPWSGRTRRSQLGGLWEETPAAGEQALGLTAATARRTNMVMSRKLTEVVAGGV